MKIVVDAPIDTIPLFVRAGSIIPLGSAVESTHEAQTIAKVRVYPGGDSDFTLFSDDGQTYAYEKGAGTVTRLHWDDASRKFTHQGKELWTGSERDLVEVVGR
jgi:alpha-glucosidase (family GH31 glycosyl hydrolase)